MKGPFFLETESCCRYVGIMFIPIYIFPLYADLSSQVIELTQSLWHTIPKVGDLALPGGLEVQKEVKSRRNEQRREYHCFISTSKVVRCTEIQSESGS